VKISHKLLIVRKKGVDNLTAYLSAATTDDAARELVEQRIAANCQVAVDEAWEVRQGALMAACAYLEYAYPVTGDVAAAVAGDNDARKAFRQQLLAVTQKHLEDAENRIRLAVGELLQQLARVDGVATYDAMREQLITSIENNYLREEKVEEKERADAAAAVVAAANAAANAEAETAAAAATTEATEDAHAGHDHAAPTKLVKRLPGEKVLPKSKHDTEGWKALETSFKALQAIIVGCGAAFSPHITDSLLALLYRSLTHKNRFVRETGYFCLGSISSICDAANLGRIADTLTAALAKGLADNWSQVRYAASVSTRALLDNKASDVVVQFYPRLVPPMCLNRYYVAEGVRLYSQATWKQIFGATGCDVVGDNMATVAPYYVMQSEADNHAVRESACHCIAELATKVDNTKVAAYVPELLKGLLICFRDESWPVRDAASCACGSFVAVFKEESRPVLKDLYQLWFEHVGDNIPSVREGTAVALGKVLKAYGDEALEVILPKLKEGLPKAMTQKKESQALANLENVTTFGVAAPKRVKDDPRHENQQVFSCGSLAPKLKRGAGCMDHGFRRPTEPWESSDGYVYMLRELAIQRPELIAEFIPMLADVARVSTFVHHTTLKCSVWKCVPVIAESMGKKEFKRVLEHLMEPLFKALKDPNRLCQAAAGDCIVMLSQFIGPTIFRGRCDAEQQALMDANEFCVGLKR
jgi:hypothetical protein